MENLVGKSVQFPHEGHETHLCYLVNLRFHEKEIDKYRLLVKEANFLCKNCGRVAAHKDNLCNPTKLK